ncbi:hypothetical protein BV898_19084 [Hypsibius exemplaris]|uniref:Uncharacterized protein n=1 Tax=Hypsibius exemplaris TaxID=2072580 RepID=A0A9X6NIN0_HYPEX|nr:hypothetical protein BV898_19084 [Hypsibius exemplaris]
MPGTTRDLVTACLRWLPSDRLSAKDLSQYIAKVTLKNSQTIALNFESSKDVRRTNVLTILSGIPTILGRIIKALIEAGAGARWLSPELAKLPRKGALTAEQIQSLYPRGGRSRYPDNQCHPSPPHYLQPRQARFLADTRLPPSANSLTGAT